MRNLILIFCTLIVEVGLSQARLAFWSFDALAASPNTPLQILPNPNGDSQSLSAALYADGTNGSSFWKTSSTGNELSSQAGTNLNDLRSPAIAGNALTLANTSANGKAIVLRFSMSRLRDPLVSFALRSTATGFSTHTWSWSIDGVLYNVADTYNVNRNSTFYVKTLDLSSINELDGAPNVFLKLIVDGATASNGNNRIDNITLTATIPTLPKFAVGFPKLQSITAEGFIVAVMLNGPGTTYFEVLDRNAPPPSSEQIKMRQDGQGSSANEAGIVQCPMPNFEYDFEFHGLIPEHEYVAYVVAENVDGLQNTPVALAVTTLVQRDLVPPLFTKIPSAKAYDTSIILRVSLNEPGSIYSVGITAGYGTSTTDQVIRGVDSNNMPVSNERISVARAGVEYLIVLANLKYSTDYNVYVIAMDTAENIQSELTKLTVTTNAGITRSSNAIRIATYNLDFFATDVKNDGGIEFGPADDTLQAANVAAVFRILDADIFALQEISNDSVLKQVVLGLPDHKMILSDRWSHSWQAPDAQFPPQKIGFVYNTRVATLVDYEVLFAELYDSIQSGSRSLSDYPGSDPSAFWSSGRLPFTARFDLAVDGVVQRVRVVVIHSKSGSMPDDYNRRVYDVKYLFDYLKSHFVNDKIVLLGDFNDDVDQSVKASATSPYDSFVADESHYSVLTYDLSQSGQSSFPGLKSFIDHMIISSEMKSAYVANSVTLVHADDFIENYAETTSDHLPVVATFLIKRDQVISFPQPPRKIFGDQPFTLTAVASSLNRLEYTSSDPSVASIKGNELTILRSGVVDIIASQPGDVTYYPAEDVSRTLIVDKASQVIMVEPVVGKILGDPPFELVASATSALTVSTTAVSSNISVAGGRVTMQGAGNASIIVSQPGNENYLPVKVTIVFCVAPAAPIITQDLSTPAILSSNAVSGNQWFLNGSPIAGAIGSAFKITQDGNYRAQVNVENCRSAFSNEISVLVTDVSPSEKQKVIMFPNPADEYISVDGLPARIDHLQVVDLHGIVVETQVEQIQGRHVIRIWHLPSGLYCLVVSVGKTVHRFNFVRR